MIAFALILFSSRDDQDGDLCTTYARISSVEAVDARDLEDFWEEPVSHIFAQGGL